MRFYRPFTSVEAMTFDLDDTLYNNEPIIQQAEATLSEYIKARYPKTGAMTPAQWRDLKRALIKKNIGLASDMGELRMHSLRHALRRDIADDQEREAAATACFNCFYTARSNFSLHTDVHEVLSQLAKRIPLIAITNGNVDPKRTGMTTYFHTFLHASLTYRAKPAADMFNKAASLLALPPQRILHVGDNMEKDVMGAIDAGFQTAWLAVNRRMDIRRERVTVLPHVSLQSLRDLLHLIPN
ncbi:HAD-IA family hydrolase [Aestuariibacter sp. A3R04]|uniref:HAD-IA family hydrolase n=1 Tax=Aestuariibacter sp. A3R04 TaxID=2841571 RepID=UPI001C09E888|nr:HAD-IA family hydrolase [Aestuariibacter sp. A3R04]MBU3023674.1 HAD-IA family hydrolase [Aestuariibacter sp. A3R04]